MAHTKKMESRCLNYLSQFHNLNNDAVEHALILMMENGFTTTQIDKVFNIIRKTGITALNLVEEA
jgi:predicted transcriptional regulator